MTDRDIKDDSAIDNGSSKTDELQTFLLLTVVLAPVVAVATVGGYGFLVWMWQLIFGPPGA